MIRKGTNVKWTWGSGTAEGKVEETFKEEVSRTIKGNQVTRHGEKGNKALLIKTGEGDKALKLESEVERVS
ncbi:DUF2945 domain-containing protein [Lewinella sp. 4G2]|uniref:DUF2945 domain-containing protein n=1 Tax=Lewinella sp. 4G2 TaxID=1803372 RepID=UPI0007B49C1B|nr:DUF2945 domain-containing protein [Lewinella sp. 4G2]OAV45417.1 hypothetical protein A3850_013345 [Lewinella sp. 4G2]